MHKTSGDAARELYERSLSYQGSGPPEVPELVAGWLSLVAPELDRPLEVSVQLLDWSGGLWGLLRTPARIVATRWSLSEPAVQALQLAARLGSLGVLAPEPLSRVAGSQSVFQRFAGLGAEPRESFWALGLSSRNHVLVEERIAEGGANLCALEPRDVLRPLVASGATRAVFVHNHPSGDPQPSPEDLALTRRLAAAAALLGVQVLDHVIVGRGCYRSLLDDGVLGG